MDNPARYYSLMLNIRPERGGPGGKYWYASWTDASGKRIRKSLGPAITSKAKAKRACTDLAMKSAVAGDEFAVPGAALSLLAWLRTFLLQRTAYSIGTQRLYRQAVGLLAAHCGDTVTTVEDLNALVIQARSGDGDAARRIRRLTRLDQVTRKQAAEFRQAIAKGRTETTIRKHIRTLRSYFGEAVRQDIATLNPFDRQAGTTPDIDTNWVYVDDAALARILDACPDAAWRAFFALARYAGLRLNEICRLSFADIDWNARTLAVANPGRAKTTKHRARVTPISPALYDVLRDRYEDAEPGESVVGQSYAKFNGSSGPARSAMARILAASGVPAYGKPAHTLRKSCQTDWLRDHPISDVCEWMGNSPAVAMKHYHQSTAEARAKVSRPSADAARIAELEAELARLKNGAELP